MGLKDIWRREVLLPAMRARARRKDALTEARWKLEEWADYGDPARLDEALQILRRAEQEAGGR